jgi:hypothetical protein
MWLSTPGDVVPRSCVRTFDTEVVFPTVVPLGKFTFPVNGPIVLPSHHPAPAMAQIVLVILSHIQLVGVPVEDAHTNTALPSWW